MLNNEQGSSLLVVMLMITIFTVLGISILATSIGGAKRTEIREEQVVDDLEAIRKLNEAVAFIKKTIDVEYDPKMSLNTYKNLIRNDIVENDFGYQIENISSNYDTVSEDKDFTRVLRVTSGNYNQTVYITGMPSFLKYAIGSRGTLTLNGSTYVEKGNIYAKDKLVISNEAKYIFNEENLVVDTSLPSVANTDESLLFMENEVIDLCINHYCYNNNVQIENSFDQLDIKNLKDAFKPNPPTYSEEGTEFVEVNIEKTFKEKLKAAGFIGDKVDPYEMEIDQIISNTPSEMKITSFETLDTGSSSAGYLYVSPNNNETYIDTDNLVIDKSKWLVIDGNAIIENSGNQTMNVSANILVTGNLTIRGDIAFDSTIYVLGETTINNVNITGYNDGELILMTQGQLEIARINKFTNNEINSIKAYLYTNEDAEVYAVGSYLYVEGGIFAQGNLEINAYRGSAEDNGTSIKFSATNDEAASRLIMKNNKKLFLNQSQGLPKIDKLEVITDLMSKK